MQIADQPTELDLPHDELDRVEGRRFARLVEHRQKDAGEELQYQHHQRQRTEEVPDIEVLGRVVARELATDEFVDGHPLVEPAQEALSLGRIAALRPVHCSHYAAPFWVSSTPTTSLSGDGNS